MNDPPKQRSVVWISIATAFSLLGDQALYAVLPVYYDSLGLTAIQVGILLALNRWIRLITNALAHRMVNVGNQMVWFVAALILGAATTLSYIETGLFTVLCIARMAWGLAWSFIRHFGVQSIISETIPTRVGWTMGLYNGISRAGSAAGLFLGALLIDLVGYHVGIPILAALSLLAVPFGIKGFRPFVDKSAAHLSLRQPILLILGFSMGIVGPGLVISTLGATVDEQMDGLAIGAATATGAIIALRYLLDSLAAPYLGSLTDRFGARNASIFFFTLGCICLIVAARTDNSAMLVGAVIAFFIVATALQAGIGGTASKLGSSAYAAYVTASDLGSATGPMLGWWLVDAYGEPRLALLWGAVIFLFTALASFRAPTVSLRE